MACFILTCSRGNRIDVGGNPERAFCGNTPALVTVNSTVGGMIAVLSSGGCEGFFSVSCGGNGRSVWYVFSYGVMRCYDNIVIVWDTSAAACIIVQWLYSNHGFTTNALRSSSGITPVQAFPIEPSSSFSVPSAP